MTAPEQKTNRNDRRRTRTRQAMLDAADKVFRTKGVDQTTVNDITAAADVAYGSFYNHFNSMDDVVADLAEKSIRRTSEKLDEVLQGASRVELLPSLGAILVMRTLVRDPSIRWIASKPLVFVDKLFTVSGPYMRSHEAEAVAEGRLRPAAGHDAWIQIYPWLLLGVIQQAIDTGDIARHEETFARLSLRLIGIDDAQADGLIDEARTLVDGAGFKLN